MPINDHHQFAHEAVQKDLKELAAMSSLAFQSQLMDCLVECAAGRTGLFTNREEASSKPWPEAARLRQLALSLQSLSYSVGESDPLCDQFLDLCTIHGESDPGEAKLARAFLQQMKSGT